MWFVTDRDERDDVEVARMMERLGERAKLAVLRKRELENYLLDEVAVAAFIAEKQKAAGSNGPSPEQNSVRRAIEEEAASLREEVIRLRLERRLLKPIFLHTRSVAGSIEERIRTAIEDLTARLGRIAQERTSVATEVEQHWVSESVNQAPGSLVLQGAAKRFGATFSQNTGDSERLARLLSGSSIAQELKELLHEIARDEAPEPLVQQRVDTAVRTSVAHN